MRHTLFFALLAIFFLSSALPGSPLTATPFILAPQVLTLQDCLDIALKENRALNQSRAKATVARAKKEQVTSSQLPAASALVQNSHQTSPTSATARDLQDTHRVGLTQTISPFGKYRSLRRATESGIKAADAETVRSEIDTAFQVTRAFYDVVLAEQLRKVASESVDQLVHHRNTTKALVEAGSAPRFDLIRAEVQLSAAQPPLIRSTHAIANFLADLLNLIGLDPTATPKVEGAIPETVPSNLPLNEQEAIQTALSQRPDLKSALANAEAAKHNMAAARKSLQPSIQFAETLEETRGSRSPVDRFVKNQTTQIGLVFPFFDSGLSRAQTREAAAVLEQARLGYENTLSALHIDVRKSISGLTESFEVLKSQEKNVEQAQEALTIAEKAYQTGAKTSLDVLDAQVALTQARTLRFQALHAQAVALAQFERALGIMPGTFFLQETEAQVQAPSPAPASPSIQAQFQNPNQVQEKSESKSKKGE